MIDSEDDDALESGAQEDAEDPSEEAQEYTFDPVARVLEDYEASKKYFSDWHDKIQEEVEFVLDQQQHENDLGHDKNQNEAQVKDMSLLSMERRKWSQLAAAPVYVNAFGQDAIADPYSAERTKWALEREVYSPQKMFRRHRKRAIIGAVVGRKWYLTFGWNPHLQEITYGTLPPTDVFKCPGFIDAHDPECPHLILRFKITVAQARARARYYGQMSEEEILEIAPDTGSQADSKPSGPLPGMVRLDRSNPEGGPAAPRERTVTLLVAMYREDPEQAEVEEVLGAPEKLPPDEQKMRCWDCGYETQVHWRDQETGNFPPVGDPCPHCSAPGPDGETPQDPPAMEAVTETENYLRYPKHPNGRWTEVLEESRTQIYDGDWPYQKPNNMGTLRSFPIGEYYVYDDPRNEIPHSDTSWQWNQQLLATLMLQWAIDQMRTSGRILIFPRGALVDGKGRPFIPNNRIDNIAWVKDPMLAKAIQEFQPRGLPDGWANLYGALQNTFRANLGTGELGLGPEQSKNLPVGTAHAIIESGDIPVDDALQNIRDEDGHVLEVVADMIQCCWNVAKWVRYLGQDGIAAFEYFSGADLCDVDVMITGDPAFDVLQSAKLERMQKWFSMTPPQQKLAGQMLNLDPTLIGQYQQEQFAYEQQMLAAGQSGEGGGQPPGQPGSGGAGPRQGPPPQRQIASPARTNLTSAGVDSLSPDLQAGLQTMIQ